MAFLKDNGLDARYLLFVLSTMTLSLILGGVVSGVFAAFVSGSVENLLAVPFFTWAGGAFVIPMALIFWGLPSAIIFGFLFGRLHKGTGERRAAMFAASVTTLTSIAALIFGLNKVGADADVFGFVMIGIAPVAIVLAPLVAGQIYGRTPHSFGKEENVAE